LINLIQIVCNCLCSGKIEKKLRNIPVEEDLKYSLHKKNQSKEEEVEVLAYLN